MSRFLKIYNWVSIALSAFSMTAGSAMGYNPAISHPEIMQSIDSMKVTVMGTSNTKSEALVNQLKSQIRSSLQSQLFEKGVSAPGSTEGKPANYAVLFRVSSDGPKLYRTRVWLELYDVVTHDKSGTKTHALMWGKEHIVQAKSREAARKELLSRISKSTTEMLKAYQQTHRKTA